MNAQDIKLDSDGDLFIDPLTGDFAIADSDKQHIIDILNAFPGWWKEFPSVGVGMQKYIDSSGKQQEIERAIKLQLQADGYQVDTITATQNTDGTFNVTANAQRN